MQFIYENLSVLAIGAAVSLITWSFGGTHGDLLVKIVPWAMLFVVEIMLAFPQRREGESLYDARSRMFEKMKRDPLVWTALGLILFLAIPFVNNGLCPNCDRALIRTGIDPAPPLKLLPGCVNRLDHLNVFLWFFAALITVVGVRHSLCGRGKRMLVKFLVWNGFALAILGFVQVAADAEGPLWTVPQGVTRMYDFFSVWGYPNMAGEFFTMMFGFAAVAWRSAHIENRREENELGNAGNKSNHAAFWYDNLYLIPALTFFVAAVNTLSRAAIVLVSALALLFFAHTFMSFSRRMSRADRVRKGVITFVTACVITFFCIISLPEDVQHEVDSLNTESVLNRVSGKGEYHSHVAWELFKDHPLYGCGGWGYRHLCFTKMTDKEIRHAQIKGGANVHNDWLQFLTEHGILGFGTMVIICWFLYSPILFGWKKLFNDVRFAHSKQLPAKPVRLFVLPAPIFFLLLTVLAAFIHGFCDCTMRSPAVLIHFFIAFAVMEGYMPRHARPHLKDKH